MVGDRFWNCDFCFVPLCYKEAVKIFIRIKILVENISKIFPASMERLLFVITFCSSSDTRKEINSLLSLLGDKKQHA